MKRIAAIIGFAALAVAATANAQQLVSGVARTDKLAVAQNFELKGDIARAREAYPSAISFYRSALRTNNKDPKLYNKLGHDEYVAMVKE